MFTRILKQELKELARQYPIITVLGPRQSGKTTLVQNTFPEKPYVNLEAPDIRELAQIDAREFLAKYPNGAILDEIQRSPQLLSYLQLIVDHSEQKGMFILTGSHQLELYQAISQSLAGRTALLNLLPLSLVELHEANIELALDEILLHGGYPRIYKDHLDPTKAYRNYFQTYVERDLRQLVQVKDLSQFQRFIKICAGRIGQILNLESIGNEIGASSHTVKHWISILEASFIVIRLQPYYENFGKRSIKSAKLYFSDVGLAAYLLGIENTLQMSRDPLRGNLVENLVFLELYKARINQGLDPQLYFFRDTNGNEIDFVFQTGRELVPIEVKAAKTFNKAFLKNLTYFKNLIEDRFSKGYVIYTGDVEQKIDSFEILNYNHAAWVCS